MEDGFNKITVGRKKDLYNKSQFHLTVKSRQNYSEYYELKFHISFQQFY